MAVPIKRNPAIRIEGHPDVFDLGPHQVVAQPGNGVRVVYRSVPECEWDITIICKTKPGGRVLSDRPGETYDIRWELVT